MLERKGKKFIKIKEGPEIHGICLSTFVKRAREAGAVIKLGRSVIIDVEIFENYLDSFRLPPEK